MTKSDAMSRREARKRAERFNSNEQILITQVIGSVIPDAQGEQPPMAAALLLAAEFVTNNFNDEPMDLTFKINDVNISLNVWPDRQPNGDQPMDIPAY